MFHVGYSSKLLIIQLMRRAKYFKWHNSSGTLWVAFSGASIHVTTEIFSSRMLPLVTAVGDKHRVKDKHTRATPLIGFNIEIWVKQKMDCIGGIAAQNKYGSGTGLTFENARVVRPHNIVTNGHLGKSKKLLTDPSL